MPYVSDAQRKAVWASRNERKKKKKKKKSVAKKKDKCYYKAKAKYDVFPSAYASGYIAKCRKRGGNIK